MRLFRILNRLDSSATPSGEPSRQRVQLQKCARYLWSLSIIVSVGLMFSTSVFAQANGSKPVMTIKYVEELINYANTNGVCSSTYITNSTYRAECSADVSALTSLVNTWESNLSAGTLTVAYDAEIENDLYAYEAALRTVLNDAGYQYSAAMRKDGPSLAYQMSPDEIPPGGFSPDDNTAYCAGCAVAATSGYVVCLYTIPSPVIALICGIGVAAAWYTCAADKCLTPTEPPRICSLRRGSMGTGLEMREGLEALENWGTSPLGKGSERVAVAFI
jgi:hypothetical protein